MGVTGTLRVGWTVDSITRELNLEALKEGQACALATLTRTILNPCLPPIMVGLVDEEQDLALLHEDPVAVLRDVLEVVDDADKRLVAPHGVAVAAAEALKHGDTITSREPKVG